MKLTGILVLVMMFFAHFTHAQDEGKPKTLIGKVKRVAGYVGPMMQFGKIGNEVGVFSGGGTAFIFNRSFVFGGYGMGLASTVNKSISYDGGATSNNVRLNFGHGGFLLGGVIGSNNVAHLVVTSQFGFGGASAQANTGSFYEKKAIFVVSPQAEAEINLTSFMRLTFGAGYRIVSGYTGTAFSNSELGGAYGCMSLKIGWFN